MANAGNQNLKVFVEHGEKIALGVAALLLVGYLLSSAVGSKADPASQTLAGLSKKVKEDLDSDHKELQPPKAGDQTRSALAPFNTPPPTPAADPWIASYATKADIRTTEKPVDRPKDHVMPEPANLRSEVELGVVKVNFDVTLVDVNKVEEAPITKFLLERRKDGEPKWTALAADLAPVTRLYEDGKVEANTVYFYRLTAFTSDMKAINANRGQGKPSAELKVLSADIWKFTVLQVFPDEDAEVDQLGKGRVQIVITKFHKEANDKFNMSRTYDGDKKDVKLGFEGGKSVKDFTTSKGKFPVDFDCGLEIQSIRENTKRSKTGKKAYDVICVTSDRKKKVILLYPEEAQAQPTPTPDPKKKEEEAVKAIEAADKLWETDKKAAGAKYAEVLKTFADSEAVKKRKQEFEDRIKTAPK